MHSTYLLLPLQQFKYKKGNGKRKYKDSRSRNRLCRIEHRHAAEPASRGGGCGCGSRKGGTHQPPPLAYPGRIHREIPGREKAQPQGYYRCSRSLQGCQLRGNRHANQLRPREELLRHIACRRGHPAGQGCEPRCHYGHQEHHPSGLHREHTPEDGQREHHLRPGIPAREQGALRQSLP